MRGPSRCGTLGFICNQQQKKIWKKFVAMLRQLFLTLVNTWHNRAIKKEYQIIPKEINHIKSNQICQFDCENVKCLNMSSMTGCTEYKMMNDWRLWNDSNNFMQHKIKSDLVIFISSIVHSRMLYTWEWMFLPVSIFHYADFDFYRHVKENSRDERGCKGRFFISPSHSHFFFCIRHWRLLKMWCQPKVAVKTIKHHSLCCWWYLREMRVVDDEQQWKKLFFM